MGLIDGLRVLDFSRVLAGPYCTMVLGDLGAEVLKMERPERGDDLRWWGPPFVEEGTSTYFAGINRGKKSLQIDLGDPEGRERAYELMRHADVVVENFRTGTMDRFGLGYADLAEVNPGIVFCAITGFGDIGPMADAPGYDILMQGYTGLMSVTGPRDGNPTRVGVAVVDILTGLQAATSILGAIHRRHETGRGAQLSTSLYEAGLAGMPNITASYLLAGVVPGLTGNEHPHVAPYGVFDVADGQVILAIGNDAQYATLLDVLGDEELSAATELATNDQRLEQRERLNALLGKALQAWTREELTAALGERGVPAGPINAIDDALGTEQAAALDVVLEDDGQAVGVANPVRVDGERLGVARHAPRLGDHDASYEELRARWAQEQAEG